MTPADRWEAGSTYEAFMGRWSRPLARAFVSWLDAPAHAHWLDVGTGTGSLAAAICDVASPASVVGCDPSATFIDVARNLLDDDRVSFEVAGAGSLPQRDGGYDAVVSGLALNFMPDAAAAIDEQLGIVRRGGLVGAFVWDYAEGMQFLRFFWDAAAAISEGPVESDEGKRFSICHPERLASVLDAAGAERVRGTALTVPTPFASFDDYWQPFLGGPGPSGSFVSTLTDTQRDALAAELHERLPIESDGSIKLQARAWAVAGLRPER